MLEVPMTIESATHPGETARAVDPPTTTTWREEIRRIAIGLGLASLYGLALGAREGGSALVEHAIGVPLAMLGVLVLAVPSLYIGLAIFDAPVRPLGMAHAAARGVFTTGLVLGGLGPAAGLFVVTTESPTAAAVIVAMGLTGSALLGLRTFFRALWPSLDDADHATATMSTLVSVVFAMVAMIIAGRVWWTMLPLIGGAS
jgi:hypothetical protein